MFWKGMFLCLFASCIHSTTSGSMCRSTQQWCRGHVRSADCIQVRPVFVRQCTTSSSAQSIASSVLVITKQWGKNLVAPIAFYASKLFLNLFNAEPLIPKFNANLKFQILSATPRLEPTCDIFSIFFRRQWYADMQNITNSILWAKLK